MAKKLPIADFLTERLKEFNPDFEVRPGTGFEKLFFQPMQFIVQPFRDEADSIIQSQSFRKILATNDPNAFSEEAVDDLASNIFVDRVPGAISSGTARATYSVPVDREFAAGTAVFTGSNGKTYINPAPYSISRAQMSSQIVNGQYYFDIPVISTEFGEDTELGVGGLVSLEADPDVQSVTNPQPIKGGLSRETNTQLIARAKNSIAVRDLITGKGFNATLYENFPGIIRELRPIGLGDPEMMRDIIYNMHVGGKVDGYFAAPAIQRGSKDFVGVLIDPTRQARATANVLLEGTAFSSLGNPGVNRVGGRDPIVRQVKPKTFAKFTSTINLSNPVNLSANERIKITIDGVTKDFRVAGINPAATNRNEIVALINKAFGYEVAFPTITSFYIKSLKAGIDSEVKIEHPSPGTSAYALVFNDVSYPTEVKGDGPLEFLETTHFEIDDTDGLIKRVLGPVVYSSTGEVETGFLSTLYNNVPNAFISVLANDIVTVTSGVNAGDYRVVSIDSGLKHLTVDKPFSAVDPAMSFTIRRTGIKDNEVVYCEYYFSPLSIDIGNLVKLDEDGKTRGIRPGREAFTITDTAFIRIVSVEVIDPLTKEPTGDFLKASGGFGSGAFGKGSFGIGSSADFRLVVNSPHERFSAFEDSFIVLNSGYAGLSLRVNYDYCPEVVTLHDFVRGERERTLNGDILIKHFLPAFVEGTIEYSVDKTDTSIPANDVVEKKVREFIASIPSGEPLQFSDLRQVISRATDPFDKYKTFIKNFYLKAKIHNTDGSVTIVEGDEVMVLPTLNPFPKETNRPQSARITHWFAKEELKLVRI